MACHNVPGKAQSEKPISPSIVNHSASLMNLFSAQLTAHLSAQEAHHQQQMGQNKTLYDTLTSQYDVLLQQYQTEKKIWVEQKAYYQAEINRQAEREAAFGIQLMDEEQGPTISVFPHSSLCSILPYPPSPDTMVFSPDTFAKALAYASVYKRIAGTLSNELENVCNQARAAGVDIRLLDGSSVQDYQGQSSS